MINKALRKSLINARSLAYTNMLSNYTTAVQHIKKSNF